MSFLLYFYSKETIIHHKYSKVEISIKFNSVHQISTCYDNELFLLLIMIKILDFKTKYYLIFTIYSYT